MNILATYLHKMMSQYYLNYPGDALDIVPALYARTQDVLRRDIQAKYPSCTVLPSAAAEDIVNLIQLDTSLEAVFYYRLARELFIERPDHCLLPYLANLIKIKTSADLYYSTAIGPGFVIQHGLGVVIGPRCSIGSNFVVYQGVTVGQKGKYRPNDDVVSNESVAIGNNVTLFAGAKVIGNVHIGDNVRIAANAVLATNAESDSVYAGIPAKRIKSLQPLPCYPPCTCLQKNSTQGEVIHDEQ